MPELPEVETTRRGVAPWIEGRRVVDLAVRQRRLRWPVPAALPREIRGQTVMRLRRRAKYLLFETRVGTAILHLGMSGSLRVLPAGAPAGKHDHVDIELDSNQLIRFNDPRRFGCLLWTRAAPERHALLRDLGPEPLGPDFTGAYLHARARGRKIAIKSFVMNGRIVVGVGNIYANEALYRAGIHPGRAAGRVSLPRLTVLVEEIKTVLDAAIIKGGTTLRDFKAFDGNPGYFSQELEVYGRKDEPCTACGEPIRCIVMGQRATYYCVNCQR